MISFLEEGFSVKMGEFGSYRPAFNAESQDKEDNVSTSNMIRKKIIFTPGAKFKSMLGSASIELFNGEIGSNGSETGGRNSGGGGEAPNPEI